MGDCALRRSGGGVKYSKNIAIGSGDFIGAAVVGLWASEKPNYNGNSNSCAAERVCGHHTQMVWGNSVRLRCARVQCDSVLWFITCNYDPPGNCVGHRPY
ncbi:hypothetical protein RHSIM_Rhsim11G0148500 [Rhododendron simsii]|uniref:SCP domain-containing protein n=1 Tax=Rhododendron simsii TaxID=118357 RepID=A0A834G881_RHOSS|nr:hypothetical protein RHSIM_Rhsim11G0148500 [Rhododendron simsii]